MRRIKVFDRVSADGYFADANGGLDWVVPDDAIDAEAGSSLGDNDAMLFGRKTYEMFESFWPKALEDESLLPHGGGDEQLHETLPILFTDGVQEDLSHGLRHEVSVSEAGEMPGVDVLTHVEGLAEDLDRRGLDGLLVLVLEDVAQVDGLLGGH